jgi:uncharacterized protein YkwD
MKKAVSVFAVVVLIGVLFAGCATESPDVSASPDSETIRVTETTTPGEAAEQATSELILSGSNQNTDMPQQSEVPEVLTPASQETDQEQQPEKTSSAPKASDTPAKAEEPIENPQKIEKSETAATKAPQTPAATEPPKPAATATPKPTPKPTPEPTQEPTPTPEPEPEMEVMGGSFNSAVLAAVNEARAEYGNAPLVLNSGLCAQALAHAKAMAERGEIFHSCGGVESVSNDSGSARTIGIRSAVHASDLTLNAGLTSLGVGSVKIGDKQYTCVIGR